VKGRGTNVRGRSPLDAEPGGKREHTAAARARTVDMVAFPLQLLLFQPYVIVRSASPPPRRPSSVHLSACLRHRHILVPSRELVQHKPPWRAVEDLTTSRTSRMCSSPERPNDNLVAHSVRTWQVDLPELSEPVDMDGFLLKFQCFCPPTLGHYGDGPRQRSRRVRHVAAMSSLMISPTSGDGAQKVGTYLRRVMLLPSL
jgi:hypothetical protein